MRGEPLTRGRFVLQSVNEHLQQAVDRLLCTLRASEARQGGAMGDESQSGVFPSSHAATLPPPNFASITSAFAVLKRQLSGGRIGGSHHLHRRSRRKARREMRCKHCSERSSLSGSEEGACTCAASIAFVSTASRGSNHTGERTVTRPTREQLLAHPTAAIAFIPKDTSLFIAGALAGAAAKTITAPLDRLKLLLQVRQTTGAFVTLFEELFMNVSACLFSSSLGCSILARMINLLILVRRNALHRVVERAAPNHAADRQTAYKPFLM